MKKGKLEIDYRGQFDVDIILDGEPLTNIYGLDLKIRPDTPPELTITPQIKQAKFGGQASIEMYIDGLSNLTAELLLDALNERLGNAVNPDEQ